MIKSSGVCAIVPRHQEGHNPKVIGMGILIDEREMVTCAHVVDAAIGEGWFCEPGDGVLQICFPFAEGSVCIKGTVDRNRYFPPERAEEGKLTDIAVVRLSTAAPAAVGRAVLQRHIDDAPVKVFGFRRKELDSGEWESHPDGEIVESKVLGQLPGGRVYFEGLRSIGATVEPGFSGAAVYAPRQSAVVGMVVKASAEIGKSSAQFIDVPSLLKALGQANHESPAAIDPRVRAHRTPTSGPPTILIRVQRLDAERYHLQSWMYPTEGTLLTLVSKRNLGRSEIPKFLGLVRSYAIKRLNNLALNYSPDEINVEFVLSCSDIDLEVDGWEFEYRGSAIRIGSHHRVYVRRAEAHEGSDLHSYIRSRSTRVATTRAFAETLTDLPHEGAAFVLTCERVTETLVEDLLNAKEVSCVWLICSPDGEPDSPYARALNAVFVAGVPVALWMRTLLWDEATVREKLTALCAQEGLVRLPDKVRTERRAAKRDPTHVGNHLILLYEDPNRPVPNSHKLRPGPEGRSRR
jgi:hypothetical protein